MVLGNTRMGGVQAFILNLLQNIDRSRYKIDLAINFEGEGGGVSEQFRSLGCDIFFLPYFKVYNYFYYVYKWKQFFRKHHYDIVHGHSTNSASVYLKVAKEVGCATIAHSHSGGYRGNTIQQYIKKYYANAVGKVADYWFACSDAAAIRLFGRNYSDYAHYYSIPNAIDVEKYKFDVEKATLIRKSLDVKEGDLLCGHVGTFSVPKNHVFLIDIFFEVVKLNPRAKLICCGAGALQNDIKEKAEKLGLLDNIIFAGVVMNANEYMMAMDVFVFPSLFEGFPVSVIEAESTGLPVVMSDTITTEVDITNLVHRLSLNDSAEKWAECICDLSRRNREEYNKTIAKSEYNIKESVKLISKLYDEMVDKQ